MCMEASGAHLACWLPSWTGLLLNKLPPWLPGCASAAAGATALRMPPTGEVWGQQACSWWTVCTGACHCTLSRAVPGQRCAPLPACVPAQGLPAPPWLPPALRCKACPVPTAHPVPLPCCRSCVVPGYISCTNLFTVNAGYCLLGKGEGEGTVPFWTFACELPLPGTLCLAVPSLGGGVGLGLARWLLPSRHRLL